MDVSKTKEIKIKNNDSVLVCILDEKYISQYYEILNQLIKMPKNDLVDLSKTFGINIYDTSGKLLRKKVNKNKYQF